MSQIDPSELKKRKLGRVLTKMGKVSRETVHEALAKQRERRIPLGELLVELGELAFDLLGELRGLVFGVLADPGALLHVLEQRLEEDQPQGQKGDQERERLEACEVEVRDYLHERAC